MPERLRPHLIKVSRRPDSKNLGDYLIGDIRRMEGRIPTSVARNYNDDRFLMTDTEAGNFGHVWSQLSRRSTTRPEDALPILATLHNLDPKEIETLDSAAQMRAILRSQETLPFALFTAPLSRNDRVADAKEERWVPKALSHDLKLSSFALHVEEDGLVIIPTKRSRTDRWFRRPPPPYLPGHDLLLVKRPDLHSGKLSLMWNDPTFIRVVVLGDFERLAAYETVVLILECPNELSPTRPMLRPAGKGACFMLERFEGDDMHVSFESPVSWELVENNASPGPVHWSATKSFRSHSLELCRIIIDCRELSASSCTTVAN
jgi:hypothetical protein